MATNRPETLALSALSTHPWQVNVPNISGRDWNVFLKDVERRGVQEPITVSLRTGVPVIIDGHQRARAARDAGLSEIPVRIKDFADEGEEITFLAGVARFRRHLNDFQRVEIGRAYEAYFRPKAAEARKLGNGRGGQGKSSANLPKSSEARESVPANLPKQLAPVHTDAQAAETVGMSERQYRKAKQVSQKAPEPVREAWAAGSLSTHAAHDLTRAPDPIQRAISDRTITPQQGVAIQRDKALRAQVTGGKVSVQQAASQADRLKAQIEERNRAMGTKLAHEAHDDLLRITDRKVGEWLEALDSRENLEVWGGSLIGDMRDAIRHLQEVERQATAYTVETVGA